jgi:hypothetical protein
MERMERLEDRDDTLAVLSLIVRDLVPLVEEPEDALRALLNLPVSLFRLLVGRPAGISGHDGTRVKAEREHIDAVVHRPRRGVESSNPAVQTISDRLYRRPVRFSWSFGLDARVPVRGVPQ